MDIVMSTAASVPRDEKPWHHPARECTSSVLEFPKVRLLIGGSSIKTRAEPAEELCSSPDSSPEFDGPERSSERQSSLWVICPETKDEDNIWLVQTCIRTGCTLRGVMERN